MEHSHHFRIWFWLSFLSPLSLSKPFLSFSEHTASASLTVPLPPESPLLPFPVPFCSSFIRCNKKVPDMFTWSRHSSSQQLSMVLSCYWIMYKHLSQVPDTPLSLFPLCFPILSPTVYPHQKAPANFLLMKPPHVGLLLTFQLRSCLPFGPLCLPQFPYRSGHLTWLPSHHLWLMLTVPSLPACSLLFSLKPTAMTEYPWFHPWHFLESAMSLPPLLTHSSLPPGLYNVSLVSLLSSFFSLLCNSIQPRRCHAPNPANIFWLLWNWNPCHSPPEPCNVGRYLRSFTPRQAIPRPGYFSVPWLLWPSSGSQTHRVPLPLKTFDHAGSSVQNIPPFFIFLTLDPPQSLN